ncbi:MAG TPA: vitamin K epoxide reductase family protein [Vicinamibacterales bacterium]
MTRRTAGALLFFALLGLASSTAASVVHYRLLADPLYQSACDINETWNCTQVYESEYGTFWGVPVAAGGVIWFAAVTLLGLVALRGAEGRGPAGELAGRMPAYIFVLSVAALAVVLYLAWASFFVLGTYCIYCLVTYLAVAGLFVVSGIASDGAMNGLPRRALRDLRLLVSSPVALAGTVAFAAASVALAGMFPRPVGAETAAAERGEAPVAATRTLDAAEQSNFELWYASLPVTPLAIPNDGAKVLVVKFNDYQCPPCRLTYEQYKPVFAKYEAQHPGQVKFITKDFPLEPECNPAAPSGRHLAACEAAVAVRLARAKGKASAMEEWIFANQPQMTPDLIRQGARSIGGITDFDEQYAKTLELVRADARLGQSLQVTGTPTFFINGRRIPIIRPEFLDAAIAYELRR